MLWGMVVIAALPSAPPELLVDIDTQHSTSNPPQLVGANSAGVIFAQFVPDGGGSLFWTTWDGAAVELAPTLPAAPESGVAFALGEGFIVFRALDDRRYSVERLSFTPEPQLEPLVVVTGLRGRTFTNQSLGKFWWGSAEGTFVTDGTPAGTRKLTELSPPRALIGEALIFAPYPGTVQRLENGVLSELGFSSEVFFMRAGDHLVLEGRNPTNEAGEALSSALANSECYGEEADRYGWLFCASPDGGRDIVVTDGTPAGTTIRFHGDRFLNRGVATDDLLIFSGIFDGGGGMTTAMALEREGSAPPTPYPCVPSVLIGETVLCSNSSLSPLAGTEVVRSGLVGPSFRVQPVGKSALLQIPGQAQFLLSDGTRAGTRLVPSQLPPWPTESSKPKLFASDGVRALFTTTRGAWITDGTREGSFRVGDDAEFFGHSVLAADGAFVVHGADGQQWQAPFGTIGVAGGLLVGRVACDAFMVDEDRVKTPLTGLGCVELIKAGRDGALLRNAVGNTWLLRKGHEPYPLPGDVQLSAGVSCGDDSCWFITKGGGDFLANRLTLASGEVKPIRAPLAEALPFFASDQVFVTGPRWSSRFALHPNDVRTELEVPSIIAPDGQLLAMLRDGVTPLDGMSNRPGRALPGCVTPWQLGVTGDTLHAICTGDLTVRLYSGALDGGDWAITEVDHTFAATPTLPTGSDVWAWSISRPFLLGSEFLMSDGQTTVKTPELFGGDFTRVRGGYVFVGTRTHVSDLELWVVPVPQSPKGCGCGQGGAICTLGLVLLLRRRRSSGA